MRREKSEKKSVFGWLNMLVTWIFVSYRERQLDDMEINAKKNLRQIKLNICTQFLVGHTHNLLNNRVICVKVTNVWASERPRKKSATFLWRFSSSSILISIGSNWLYNVSLGALELFANRWWIDLWFWRICQWFAPVKINENL